MSNEEKSLQSVKKVKSEDFTTINPMAIWEAEKRLFYLPLVNLADQVEAANYLKSNRLDYSYEYIREGCKIFDCPDYDFNNQVIPVSYENPWFAPWVESVKVFWNRIEYIISEPNKEKHEAFRKSCTSNNAFNATQRFSADASKDFPVEKLKTIEDIPAIRHDFDEISPFGTVFLSEDEENCKKISICQSPFWIWEDEGIAFVWSKEKDFDLYLNQKARDELTKRQIDFLNGFFVSDEILNFIFTYCMNDESKIIDLDEASIASKKGKRHSDDVHGKVNCLKSICEIIEMFHEDYQNLLLRLLSRNEWLQTTFGLER